MMNKQDILDWLRQTKPLRLEDLWRQADQTRREHVGNEVHLRGLIEISNHCARQCAYCGLRAGNRALQRYRLRAQEVLACAHQAVEFGHGTVVLQGGEDYGITREWMADVIGQIKRETPLAVTLSLGERSEDDFKAWRDAGADRYLLRFETSDRKLYDFIHPGRGGEPSDRIAMLGQLKRLGYEVGSGIMVGLPGQKYQSVAADILLFRELDLDMIGIGPFLPHPATPLRSGAWGPLLTPVGQVPSNELMVYKVMALARLICPDTNIPSTTALATINQQSGRELGLQRGANVLMCNLTPTQYRRLYEIYPGKVCLDESGSACHRCLTNRIGAMGRAVGCGPGGRRDRHKDPLQELQAKAKREASGKRAELAIKVCMGSSCYARGNSRNLEVIQTFLSQSRVASSVELVGHLCQGHCHNGPNVTINGRSYQEVDPVNLLDVLNHTSWERTE
jgi:biotin synthase